MRVAVHASDVDGIVCAALILMKYPNAKIDFLNVGEALRTEVEYDLVVDLPKPANCAVNVDHHASNYERLISEGRLAENDVVDPTAPSAATLLVKYLGLQDNPKARRLVELAEIADTGRYSRETYILDKIIKCNSGDAGKLMELAWVLAEKGDRFLEDELVLSEWRRIEPWLNYGISLAREIVNAADGVNALIVELVKGFPRLAISDLQHMFLERGQAIVVINRMAEEDPVCKGMPKANSIARFSIRVKEGFGISAKEIAEAIGGGGHPKAAGARVYEGEYHFALLKVLELLSKHGAVGYYRFERDVDWKNRSP